MTGVPTSWPSRGPNTPSGSRPAKRAKPGQQASAGEGAQKEQALPPQPAAKRDPRVAVVTAVAESVDLPITRSSVGWVEPDATVTVRARIDGQVVEQKVRDGEVVKAGDVLFRIDDREIQAQIARDEAMLAKDQATLARTQADLRRVEELLSKGSASRQQFDVVTADSKVAAANVAADQATLQADRIKLDYTVIKAPIAGRVGVVRVTPGNLVRANDTGDGLVTITQLKPLRISFSLPERELDLVRAALARNGAAPVRAYASGAHAGVRDGQAVLRRLRRRHPLRHDHGQGDVRQRGRPALARPVCAHRGRPRGAPERHHGAARRGIARARAAPSPSW